MSVKYKIKGVKPSQLIQENQTNKEQQQIVYFRLRTPAQQIQPEQQLIVNRFPRKKTKLTHDETSQNKQEQSKQVDELKQVSNLFSQFNLNKSVQFFLKRVDDMFPVGRNQSESEKVIESMNERSNQLSNNQRGLTREQLFAKSRGIQSKRVKIIDFSEEYVQLGEEKIAVENLGSMNDYYYVLSKRETIKQGPTITLPQTSNYLFDKIQFQQQNQQQSQPSEQDEDSNRQSNPDYDYPEEDYHDGDSEDEGVIHKDYYPGYQDQDERNQSDYQLDQEEVYRRYLKRCKNDRNRQSDDDQYY